MTYRLLTAEELAERWQTTARLVRGQAHKGEIPKAPIPGKYIRFRLEDIEALERGDFQSDLADSKKRPRTARTAGGMAPGGQS